MYHFRLRGLKIKRSNKFLFLKELSSDDEGTPITLLYLVNKNSKLVVLGPPYNPHISISKLTLQTSHCLRG